MRVSFLGKGGSGKTTVAAAFIKHLDNKNKNVLAIDADMNVHLGKTLEMPILSLGEKDLEIENYLEENRTNGVLTINFRMPVIGTTPPALSSRFIKMTETDAFLSSYATSKNNIRLLTVGTYNEGDVGYSCYHGKLGTAELIFNRLLDTKQDFVVADGTAGVDSLGTSMFFVSDINVFVIEPTQKSVSVLEDFEEISKKLDIKNYVIVNKVEDQQDIDFIEKHIDKSKIIGYIKQSRQLKKVDQGDNSAFDEFVEEQKELFNKLEEILSQQNRDWDKYYQILLSLYQVNIDSWYNAYYGEDLAKFIDTDFSYKKVI